MKIIYKGNRSGKTKELLKDFIKDTNGLFVCMSSKEKLRVRTLVQEYYDKRIKMIKESMERASKKPFPSDQTETSRERDIKMNRVVTLREILSKRFRNGDQTYLNAYVDDTEQILDEVLSQEGIRLRALSINRYDQV